MKLLILTMILFTGCATKPVYFACEHGGVIKACSFKATDKGIAIQAHEGDL